MASHRSPKAIPTGPACYGAAVALLALGPHPTVAQTVRDSAGIQIVENERPVWVASDVPRLARSPAFVIGYRQDPDYVLSRVAGAARLSDGRIAIADGSSLQIKFFDAQGELLNMVGGRGEGPGEFDRLEQFGVLPGDTLYAVSMPETVSFLDPDGAFLRRVVGSRLPTGLPPGRTLVVAVLGDQSLAVGPLPIPSPVPGQSRWIASFPFVIVGRDTTKVVPLGKLPAFEMAMDEGQPTIPWFGAQAAFAAHGPTLFVGYGGEYVVRVFSSSGRLERIIRRRWTPTRVTADDIDEYVTEWAKRWIKETGPEAERRKQDLRDDPYASVVPACAEFLADRTGRLWVREAHLADVPGAGQFNALPLVPSIWSLFDVDGRWLGDITMPARFRPTDIGVNYVLGVQVDTDGVETVVEYPYGPDTHP